MVTPSSPLSLSRASSASQSSRNPLRPGSRFPGSHLCTPHVCKLAAFWDAMGAIPYCTCGRLFYLHGVVGVLNSTHGLGRPWSVPPWMSASVVLVWLPHTSFFTPALTITVYMVGIHVTGAPQCQSTGLPPEQRSHLPHQISPNAWRYP